MFDWLKKKRPQGPGPDFSEIDSREKAERLFADGALMKLHLLPPEFGGDDAPQNIVYVPAFVVDIKRGVDTNTIMPLAKDRKVTRYTATPKYQGRSFIPNSIEVRASNPGSFEMVIRIWGEALREAEIAKSERDPTK
jgi:hypothetical protein